MKLLYLVHRLPYPPNKGDKVRSFHLLKHLAQQHEVHLGSFIDDPEDEAHRDAYTAALKPFVKSLYLPPLTPKRARVRSLRGLLSGELGRLGRLPQTLAEAVAAVKREVSRQP